MISLFNYIYDAFLWRRQRHIFNFILPCYELGNAGKTCKGNDQWNDWWGEKIPFILSQRDKTQKQCFHTVCLLGFHVVEGKNNV